MSMSDYLEQLYSCSLKDHHYPWNSYEQKDFYSDDIIRKEIRIKECEKKYDEILKKLKKTIKPAPPKPKKRNFIIIWAIEDDDLLINLPLKKIDKHEDIDDDDDFFERMEESSMGHNNE